MKKLTAFLMLLSLGMFTIGCEKAPEAEKPSDAPTVTMPEHSEEHHTDTPAETPSSDDLKVPTDDGDVNLGTPDIDKPAEKDAVDDALNIEDPLSTDSK